MVLRFLHVTMDNGHSFHVTMPKATPKTATPFSPGQVLLESKDVGWQWRQCEVVSPPKAISETVLLGAQLHWLTAQARRNELPGSVDPIGEPGS